MSQDYFKDKGKSSDGRGSGQDSHNRPPTPAGRPKYVTVGTGSAPESAARLQALLNNNAYEDSGYGGSIAGDVHQCGAKLESHFDRGQTDTFSFSNVPRTVQ